MEIIGYISVMLVILYYISRPLTQPKLHQALLPDKIQKQDREILERRKWELLKALKEIEFEFQQGKISASDYTSLQNDYKLQALQVLKQLDKMSDRKQEELDELVAAYRRKKQARFKS